MLDPLLLIPAILRLVKRVLQQINNLGVCFCFFLLTASQSITDDLRETVLINATIITTARAASPQPHYEIHQTRPTRL